MRQHPRERGPSPSSEQGEHRSGERDRDERSPRAPLLWEVNEREDHEAHGGRDVRAPRAIERRVDEAAEEELFRQGHEDRDERDSE